MLLFDDLGLINFEWLISDLIDHRAWIWKMGPGGPLSNTWILWRGYIMQPWSTLSYVVYGGSTLYLLLEHFTTGTFWH